MESTCLCKMSGVGLLLSEMGHGCLRPLKSYDFPTYLQSSEHVSESLKVSGQVSCTSWNTYPPEILETHLAITES